MAKGSLTCFGTGDGWPCADRNHSSFLFRLGRTALLMDCGESVSSSFKASGLSYDLIDRIFLSHLHADHIGGFLMLMQGFWLEKRTKDLTVHLPAEGIKPLHQLLNAAMIFDDLFPFRLRFEPLRAGVAVNVGPARVTPYLTSHLDALRKYFQKKHPRPFEAFSFLIESDRKRAAYSADIGRPEDLEPLVSQPLDLLLCELAHCRAETMFKFLRGRKIERIVFTHLSRSYWAGLPKTRSLARRILAGMNCGFARDGKVIQF